MQMPEIEIRQSKIDWQVIGKKILMQFGIDTESHWVLFIYVFF